MIRSIYSRLILFALLTTTGLAGCAGSEPAATGPAVAGDTAAQADTTRPSGPPLQLLAFRDGGLHYEDLQSGTSRRLLEVAGSGGTHALSPGGTHLAFVFEAADSARLAFIDLATREVTQVASREAPAHYSLAWAPGGDRLAYGYYRPRGDGKMGSGGISLAELDGSSQPVGCQSARKVFKWLPDGNLATRGSDNLYVVSTDGCETAHSLDIRKMHKITYAPDGERMAYIFRDLVYDRQNAEYVPDSTLFTANARGGEQHEVFGDAYRARHLRWSPDGTQLAFDVRSKDDRSRRQIIIHNRKNKRLTYLVPPQAAGGRDELHPRWSPEGDNLAFSLEDEDQLYAAARVMGQTRMLGTSSGPVWGWAGSRRVVVRDGERMEVKTLKGEVVHTLSAGTELLHVWGAR